MKTPFFLFLTCFLFSTLAFSTQALADYKPGTIGYLYEDCRQGLQNSKSIDEAYETVCGAFVEGYVAGILASNWIKLEEPKEEDPCHDEKQAAYEHINNRFCAYLPAFEKEKLTSKTILQSAAALVERWVGFLKDNSLTGDPLSRPVAGALNEMIRPGKFCDSLKEAPLDTDADTGINPDLFKVAWADYKRLKEGVAIKKKYERCAADLKAKDKSHFAGTRCGSEILGFITGLYSTAHLQNKKISGEAGCVAQVDRLYRSLDVKETMCVSPGTDPYKVAQVFENRMNKSDEKAMSKMQGFGAAGYETIYRGFLCAQNTK